MCTSQKSVNLRVLLPRPTATIPLEVLSIVVCWWLKVISSRKHSRKRSIRFSSGEDSRRWMS